MERNFILLTGTICPQRGVNVLLTDPEERLIQYNNSIRFFLEKTSFTDIVFIENSNYNFETDTFEEIALKHNKRFEFVKRYLSKDKQQKISLLGKSLGEADMISYAIKNSVLLSEAEVVYKITGRIIVLNANMLLSRQLDQNEFIASNRRRWVNTAFFKVRKDDYLNYLDILVEKMDDSHMHNIERLWYSAIKENKMNITCFYEMPRLHGVIANSDHIMYDKSKFKYFLCDWACKLKLYKIW